MPLRVTVELINQDETSVEVIDRIYIGRTGPLTAKTAFHRYLVATDASFDEDAVVAEFRHRYLDGALRCAELALTTLPMGWSGR